MKWLVKQSILWHRYLGICLSVFFGIWFISGIVLMYTDFPLLSEADRLVHSPPLDLSSAKFTPDEAFSRADVLDSPLRVTIGMIGARPVYRMLPERSRWITVFADDTHLLNKLSTAEAINIAAAYDGMPVSRLRPAGRLTTVDQWTVYPGSAAFFPFQLVTADDGKGTMYYVSESAGLVYLRTTRSSRFWAWCGAIPHWWYIRALRSRDAVWERTMIAVSSLGILMCLAGFVAAVLRFSPSKRYRFPDSSHRHIPYAGWKRWHYLITMVFGLVTFTWILSGLFTMNPGNWSPGADAEIEETQAFAGGALDTSAFQVAPAQAAALLRPCIRATALEMIVFQAKPYYLAQDRGAQARLLPAEGRPQGCDTRLSVPELLQASRRVVEGAATDSKLLTESKLLDAYDAYYYDRTRRKPLPVLRVKFADARKTWLYVDPGTARISARYTRRSRLERWLYQGLHDLDFPFLYWHRPAWDLTVIVLSSGGLALSITGIWMAAGYLRRSARRNAALFKR